MASEFAYRRSPQHVSSISRASGSECQSPRKAADDALSGPLTYLPYGGPPHTYGWTTVETKSLHMHGLLRRDDDRCAGFGRFGAVGGVLVRVAFDVLELDGEGGLGDLDLGVAELVEARALHADAGGWRGVEEEGADQRRAG